MLLVPMDHSAAMGPIHGLIRPVETIRKVVDGRADCVLAHEGLLKLAVDEIRGRVGMIVKLTNAIELVHDPGQLLLSNSLLLS